jgi:hypothetical protein
MAPQRSLVAFSRGTLSYLGKKRLDRRPGGQAHLHELLLQLLSANFRLLGGCGGCGCVVAIGDHGQADVHDEEHADQNENDEEYDDRRVLVGGHLE